MWVRRTTDELAEIAIRKERSRRNPRAALLFAASFAAIAFFFWAIGVPGRYSQRPPDPKSWWQIVHYGPQHFALLFGVSFLLIYGFQLISGRSPAEPSKQGFICPECHTPQHENERQCSCPVKLEPLENWKWK